MFSNAPAPPDLAVLPKITIRDCVVRRGGREVLRVDALDVPAGRVTAIIGPNGSGKSTLLAVLQLLLRPLSGDLRLDGRDMRADALATRRRLAVAFQEPLLLNMSVLRNVETGLALRKVPRGERRPRALRWLARFGIDHLAARHAHDLSGGEAQRTSLARAFALEPEVLLLDEPFAALDAPTRAALIDDFDAIVRESRITTLFVTHDRDEALRLADFVVVLIAGALRQIGPPATVFAAPADEDVAAFVGVENVWPASLVAAGDGLATFRVGAHLLDVAAAEQPARGLFCIRPEEITVGPLTEGSFPTSAHNRLPATVQAIEPAGPVVRLRLRLTEQPEPVDPLTLVASITRPSLEALGLKVGAPVPAHPELVEGRAGDRACRPVVRLRPTEQLERAAPLTLIVSITRPSLEALGLEVGTPVVATFKATAAHVIPHTEP